MLIPFGILSSAAGAVVEGATYELISTTILDTTTANVEFDVSTLATTYKHLQIRSTVRRNEGVAISNLLMRFGSPTIDTGNNFRSHQLFGFDGSVGSGAAGNTSRIVAGAIAGTSLAANVFAAGVLEILDPFSTTKNTTTRVLTGIGGTGTQALIEIDSGAWFDTDAVQTIQLFATGSFVAGSRFSLYGIR